MKIEADCFYVLTANHVVQDKMPLTVTCFESVPNEADSRATRERPVTAILAVDQPRDLALLKVPAGIPPAGSLIMDRDAGHYLPPTPFRSLAVNWVQLDHPTVMDADVVERKLARRSLDATAVSYLRIAEKSEFGMSGSALSDASGNILGIACGNQGESSYYVDEFEIHSFISSAKELHMQ